MRAGCAAIAAIVLCAQASWADGPTVAVLPWTSSSPDLEVYGEPIARAVVKRLETLRDVQLKAVTAKVAVPADVDLVIDGRVVGQGERVRLEARVRDPERGKSLSVHTTRWLGLAKLDELADELGQSLSKGIEEAVAAQAAALSAVAKAASPAAAAIAQPSRPRMVVLQVAGEVAGGAVPVTEPGTRAALDLAYALGYQPVRARERGLLDPSQASSLIGTYDAERALVVYVGNVSFSWNQVLTARGRIRIALFDAKGDKRFDRWIVTDTLVGSRGDAHAALVYFVVEQAGLIAQPLIRKVAP